MKIRILRDIPGYEAGETVKLSPDIEYGVFFSQNQRHVTVKSLIRDGWAEEVKDDIDIEAIRKSFKPMWKTNYLIPNTTIEEIKFIEAYRIVKAVIDQLNGEWEPDWNKKTFFISLDRISSEIKIGTNHDVNYNIRNNSSLLPACRDLMSAYEVIRLCEPELRTLFGVARHA